MTNSTALSQPVTAILEQLLADAGVEGTHGFEMVRLVSMVDSAYDRLLNEATRHDPVSAPRWRILLWLWIEEQMGCGAVNPTRLSRAQQVSKNTISEHLRTLEEDGLIERELDQNDRRQFRIHLTDAGRALVRDLTPAYAQMLNRLLTPFTAEEVAQIRHLLGKLHATLCTQAGDVCPVHRTAFPTLNPHAHKEDV
jgi:DNA-binding MarR family transcriptional regulator